jgi:sister chromatid cohesion protein DCC1
MAVSSGIGIANVQLKFVDSFHQRDHLLVELPDSLVSKIQLLIDEKDPIIADKRPCFSIRGSEENEAVCCTEQETFSMRIAETSNSFLLIQEEKIIPEGELAKPKTWLIHDNLSSYIELVRVTPRIEEIPNLLEHFLYKGPDHEQQHKSKV